MNLPLIFPKLLLSLALAAAPLAFYQPPWLSLGWLLIGLFRYWQVRHRRRMLAVWARVPLALLGLLGVLASYGSVAGRDPGVALLTTMLALKLLEVERPRDIYLAVYLGYFLVIANFLYSQAIPMIAYLLAAVLALTSTLVALQRLAGTALPGQDLRVAGRLLLYSLPIALVLFILFPRIDEPLWHMPDRSDRATTGISDEMTPGSISELVRSDAVAFRVEFDTAPPPPAQRYWRGPVLWFTNGRRWRAGIPPAPDGRRFMPLGEALDYRVTLEPHQGRWLFALDLPAEVSGNARITTDFQVHARDPVRERLRYRARSYLTYRTAPPSSAELRSALQRPGRASGRLQSLVDGWRTAAAADDAQVVALALAYFREQPFVYTLTPPLLGRDPVDEFLFETRRGFCEHYAAAFTLLMRYAGIPARVVTGYQGGQVNPLGDYLIVRQSDAHAWSEVWLGERGWVRIDPTAVVAPERIEQPIDAGASLGFEGAVRFRGGEIGRLTRWLEQAQLTVDALNALWDRWILGYGLEQQLALLGKIGIGTWRGLVAVLAVVAGTVLVLVGWSIIRRPRVQRDPLTRAYARFCRKLARCGLVRHPSEGPVDFARRVAAARPDLAPLTDSVTALYVAQRYAAERPGRAPLDELRRLVRALQP